MQEQEAQTACLPLAILLPCPMSATRDTAMLIKREVSDGVIAPGYTEPEALEILKAEEKRQLQCDSDRPGLPSRQPIEHKQVFGVTFEQGRQRAADQR